MRRARPFLIALALGVLAAAPLLLGPGFLSTRAGGDSPFLLFRLHQMHTALRAGVFPVRWMPDAAFGFGYPFFSYYAALPYYLAAGLKAFGFSYVAALKLTQLLGFLLAAVGMYTWTRRHLRTAWGALLASAAYTFAPFHMVNVYVRGDSLSEFYAFAFYPLILLAADRLFERRSARRVAALALAYAALLLTHNISAFIFSPFLALYLLLQSGGRRRLMLRTYGICAAAILLGVMLAAGFWLPAVGELRYVQLEDSTTGYFHYSNHFRADDWAQSGFAFDYDTDADAHVTPFAVGALQLWLTVAGGAALGGVAWQQRRRGARFPWAFSGFVVTGLLLSAFLVMPVSRPLWAGVPMLPVVQFPWRFLSVFALFSAVLTGSVLELRPLTRRGVVLGAALLCTALAASALIDLRPDFIPITDHDVTPERLQLYEYYSGNIGTTIRYEWLPRTVNPRPYTGPDFIGLTPRVKPLQGVASGVRTAKRAASQRWQISVTSDTAVLALPLYYWPGWRAEVDGRTLALSAEPGLGWARLSLPRGTHTVTLWLGRTPLRTVAEWLSLLALAMLLALAHPQSGHGAKLQASPQRRRIAAILILGAAVWLGLRILPRATPHDGPQTMDFVYHTYPYHAPDGVDFGDGLRLMRYIYDGPDIALDAEWQGGEADTALVLALPALHVLDVPVAVSQAPGPGVYLPTLTVSRYGEDRPALTADGRARGALALLPLVRTTRAVAPADAVPAAVFGDGLSLLSAELASGNPNLWLRWRADATLNRNYHVGLRLRDVAGNLWAEQDVPLGIYGAYPPALWTSGELVAEPYRLTLPPGLPPGDGYRLQISVYDAATGDLLGDAEVDGLVWDASSPALPDMPCLFTLTSALHIGAFVAPDLITQGQAFSVRVQWLTGAAPEGEYRVRWTLRGVDTGEVWSTETALAPGSSPALWPSGALIEGRLTLDPPADLMPGIYTLTLTLLDGEGAAVHGPLDLRSLELQAVPVATGTPADLSNRVDVDFGGVVRLWGYDAEQSVDALTLALTWGALQETDVDYSFFVHLFDPHTETIRAQVDTMPRGYTHPTSAWIPGEIVTDTVRLDLAGVPPGEYRVAVGWYDAEGRLPTEGGDRVVLPLVVTVIE